MLCAGAVILSVACSDTSSDMGDARFLARVGSATLSRTDLAKAIPVGLSSADSARYASTYIRRWINSHLVSDIASSEIDMTDINRLVDDYRSRLIEMEYRKRMADAHTPSQVSEDSVRNYFVNHNDEFVLERPMLRGLYLKVPDNSPNLALIRRLYRSDKASDIDRLEKEVLTSAIHYDYFHDKWIDWEQVELHIPFDFGADPDVFLKSRDHFETSAGGFVYFLDIKDVLPTGSYMPYDNARILISERLAARERQKYDAQLMDNLYKRAEADGKIQLFVDLQP